MHTDASPDQRIFRITPGWRRFFWLFPFVLSASSLMLAVLAILLAFSIGKPFRSFLSSIFSFSTALAFTFLLQIPINYPRTKYIYHIVSQAGIEYHSRDFHLFTPWHNITGIERRWFGIRKPPSLLLKEPAIRGDLKEGKRYGIATAQYGKYALIDKQTLSALPLIFTVPRRDWRSSELAAAIKHYAPTSSRTPIKARL
ncbi:hypothetical protein [Ktedonospora formicarum]|uniref:Uncharacterized protein n=1 Tax=Ktedonospora formicarum TaxID=2778364 RepID=A0A8J3IA20_9CHLR|nr:hypothetical protein [Ktedonospora formicarum]GHO50003.1 hypothetical protein KSX_81660 [Ktedonospora formicarum]